MENFYIYCTCSPRAHRKAVPQVSSEFPMKERGPKETDIT